jgi:GntR family transcriptional repressor for pyruvate dehydrogenase complex
MKKKTSEGSAVRRVAEALRQLILTRRDGEFLGSELELVELLKVSRPTFRQAAKLVEQEQLLLIKRGVGGGFFSRQPSAAAVAHVAAVYLHVRDATIEDAIRSAKPIFAEIALTAASRSDPATCARLAAFMAEDRKPSGDFRAFLRSEREFLQIFAAASGNPVLELYASVLVEFASSFVASSVFTRHPDRVVLYRGIRVGLIQAILNGDKDVATVLSHRRSETIIGWMEADNAPRSVGRAQRSSKLGKNQRIQMDRGVENEIESPINN